MQKVKEAIKRWWGMLAVVFSVAVLVGGVYLIQRPKEAGRSAAAASTQISVNPASLTKANADEFEVTVDINTGENTVSAADIEVNYDPAKLQGVSMVGGSFLPVVLVSGKAENGKATITLGSQPTDPKKGTGTLATITFKVLGNNTSTQIDVSENTQVAAIGETGNVLTGRNSSTVTIGAPASEEPTAPPTQEPTNSPTSEPTEEPTAPPTGEPTITPTGVPTDSPTDEPLPTDEPESVGGDVDGDGIVNIVDIGIIIDNYGMTEPDDPGADLNGDGIVNIVDIGIVIDNYQ